MKRLLTLGFFVGFLFFSSCKKDDLDLATNTPQFDINLFEQNIVTAINGLAATNRPVGWAYAINQNGQFFSADGTGQARAQVDIPSLSFTENTIINVASVTKFFTAIAVLQLLDERNLSLDSPITGWLPSDWTKGPGVNNLTFRDLLIHQSGLQSINTNFSQTLCFTCLQNVINTGVTGNKNVRTYLNANFALFRIIIPALWRGLPGGPPANEALTDLNTQNRYIEYLQEKVFTPAGVSGADCLLGNANAATLYYSVNDLANGTPGLRYTDWTAISGGGGYYLSAIEIASVLAYYEHTEILLSNEMKKLMKDNRIGYDVAIGTKELHGAYYGKNGSIANTNGQGILSQTLSFPMSKVEIIIVINTQGINFSDPINGLSGIMHDAYNDAWVIP